MTPTPAKMVDLLDIRRFVFGGHAKFTLRSVDTDNRFTFKVNTLVNWNNPTPRPYFLAVLNGPDNTSDYEFIGTLRQFPDGTITWTHGKGSRITKDATSAKVAQFFATTTLNGPLQGRTTMPERMEFFHSGRCCRCGRELTTPESIASGIGPVCAGKE